ncbi:Iron/zinc purple acid phosphatase-like protein C-domain-containing protein [Chiua virens]|nr:Iron/zinc purple acid phosphatase-like protein C-domain-containing protein [Chiua virens]
MLFYRNCAGCAYRATDTFTTAPEAGNETPFTVAVVVDLGLMGADGLSTKVGPHGGAANPLGPTDLNTIQSLIENKDTYDFIAHFGDIAYSDYFIKESWQGYFGNDSLIPNMTSVVEGYNVLLEQFYDQMTPLTSSKPTWLLQETTRPIVIMVEPRIKSITSLIPPLYAFQDKQTSLDTSTISECPPMSPVVSAISGTHLTTASHTSLLLTVKLIFPLVLQSPDEHGGFDAGASSGPFGYPNQQYEWFENNLASVDREKTPWVIVGVRTADDQVWRRSLYARDTSTWVSSAFLHVILLKSMLQGYERNTPVANYSVDPAGLNNPTSPWNIVNGAAGHYDGLDTFESIPYYAVKAWDNTYGWSRLTFHNRTHLTHEFVASANGSVMDSATLYKAHTLPGEYGDQLQLQ